MTLLACPFCGAKPFDVKGDGTIALCLNNGCPLGRLGVAISARAWNTRAPQEGK